MWIRGKHGNGRWADWDWEAVIDMAKLLQVREAVRTRFIQYLIDCRKRGENIYTRIEMGNTIDVPLGFTPNDFVRRIGQDYGVKVDFFNIRYLFHTIEIAGGTFDEGPQKPFKRLKNELAK